MRGPRGAGWGLQRSRKSETVLNRKLTRVEGPAAPAGHAGGLTPGPAGPCHSGHVDKRGPCPRVQREAFAVMLDVAPLLGGVRGGGSRGRAMDLGSAGPGAVLTVGSWGSRCRTQLLQPVARDHTPRPIWRLLRACPWLACCPPLPPSPTPTWATSRGAERTRWLNQSCFPPDGVSRPTESCS